MQTATIIKRMPKKPFARRQERTTRTTYMALALIAAVLTGMPETSSAQATPAAPPTFETAIRDQSSSPFVVSFTVVDDRTGVSHTGCQIAPLLVGAIQLEFWGEITAASRDRAMQIALGNTAHVYHFSKQAALNNVLPFKYPKFCSGIAPGNVVSRIPDHGNMLDLLLD